MHPYIIKDTFIQHMKVQAPECFTLSVEFISVCDNFTIMWLFSGKDITNDVKYEITSSVIKQYHYKTSIKVKQSSESDTGIYTVKIKSTTGSDSVNITVKILGKLLVICASYICSI